MDQKALGKFILWAVIALVGWSFYSTLKHETALAVQEGKIEHLKESIKIDQQLRDIRRQIKSLVRE